MTALVVPDVRVTVRAELSTLPVGIVTEVTSPLILPFVTLIGKTTENGAPVGIVALNWLSPTFSRVTVRGTGSTALLERVSNNSEDNPSKIPSGRLVN